MFEILILFQEEPSLTKESTDWRTRKYAPQTTAYITIPIGKSWRLAICLAKREKLDIRAYPSGQNHFVFKSWYLYFGLGRRDKKLIK